MDLVWSGAELFVAGPDTAPHPYSAPRARGHRPAVPSRRAARPARRAGGRAARRPGPAGRAAPGARAAGRRGDGGRRTRRGGPDRARARLPGDVPEPGLRAAAAWLSRGASAAETADALGWTTRTLHRRCLAAFGYGPAMLRRVLRFRRAVALLQAGVAPADVAARAGYADQPHLSRDVRALAGVSPARVGGHRVSPRVALGRAARRRERREQVDAGAVRVEDRRRSASPRTRRTAPARRGDPPR